MVVRTDQDPSRPPCQAFAASPQGRHNRAQYFWRTLVIGVSAEIAAFLAGFLLTGILGEHAEPAGLIVTYLLLAAGGVLMAFEAAKRLHDLDRPGAHDWLLLIAFYDMYLGLVLLLKRGTRGPTQYGDDPLAAPQAGMAVAMPAA